MSRKQSQESIARLLEEFPGIRELYAPFSPEYAPEVYPGVTIDASIKVRRADPNLIYWRPSEFHGSGAYLLDTGPEGLQGQCYETPVFLDVDHKRINGVDLSRLENREASLADVLFGDDALYKRLGTVVVLSQVFWLDNSEQSLDDTIFNDRIKRLEARILIYKAPRDEQREEWVENGWALLAHRSDRLHNVMLYGSLLVNNPKFDDKSYQELVTTIGGYAQNFQRLVWTRGFGQLVDSSLNGVVSAQIGDVNVLTFCTAGRVQVQLKRADVYFTVVGQDRLDDPRFGIYGVRGTGDELAALVDDVAVSWTLTSAEAREAMIDDASVDVG